MEKTNKTFLNYSKSDYSTISYKPKFGDDSYYDEQGEGQSAIGEKVEQENEEAVNRTAIIVEFRVSGKM